MDVPLSSYERRSPTEDDDDSWFDDDDTYELVTEDDDDSWFDDDDSYELVKRALMQDNRDDFVEFINSYSVEELKDDLDTLHVLMMSEDAAKCAAAVLDGETQIPDVTDFITCKPLHISVGSGAVRITALLLERGFSADVRCDYGPSLPHVLPLGVALRQVRVGLRLFENESISAVKFAIELVRGFAERALENLRMLAMKTRDIKHEFYNYLKEGKMVAVGALLFVARSRILSSSTGKGEFSSILEMRDFLSEVITSYANSKRLLSAGDDKLIEMEQTLVLLQILDTIGDKLEAITRQDFRPCPDPHETRTTVAASLLEDAGFHVNADDIPTRVNVRVYQRCVVEEDGDDFVMKILETVEIKEKINDEMSRYEPGEIAMAAAHKPFCSNSGSYTSYPSDPQIGDNRAPNHTADYKKPQHKKSTGLSCDYCGKPGHSKSYCYKYKRDSRPSCDYCGKPGHLKSYCYKYKRDSCKKDFRGANNNNRRFAAIS